MDNPLFPVLVRDIALLHDAGVKSLSSPGRARASTGSSTPGARKRISGGVRLTSEDALPLIEQASLGVARIMNLLTGSSLPRHSGNWVMAQEPRHHRRRFHAHGPH